MSGPRLALAITLLVLVATARGRRHRGSWRPRARAARARAAGLPGRPIEARRSVARDGASGRWQRLRAPAVRRRAQAALVDALPDAVDLLRLATASGATPQHALVALARHGDGPIAAEAGAVLDEVAAGRPLAIALERLRRLGAPADPLVDVLIGAARAGAPLAPGLERLAADARLLRRRRAEEVARALPVRLLFPLVLCTLPAFVVLTVVPLLARSLPTLLP